MPNLVRRLLDGAAAVRRPAPYVPPHFPERGDPVEAWLKAQRDACFGHASTYNAIDGLLDDYRLHADTGTPLDQHCCEGGNVDDCVGCYDAAKAEPLVSAEEIKVRIAFAHAEVARRKGATDA